MEGDQGCRLLVQLVGKWVAHWSLSEFQGPQFHWSTKLVYKHLGFHPSSPIFIMVKIVFTIFDCLEPAERLKCFKWRWYVFQLEKAPSTGKAHIQGCGEIENSNNLKAQIVKFNKNFKGHVEAMRGSVEQAATYCMKQETRHEDCNGPTWFQQGEWQEAVLHEKKSKKRQGKRSDLQDAIDAAADYATMEDYASAFPTCFFKYPSAMREWFQMKRPKLQASISTLWKWQQDVVDMLQERPDNRKVYWFFDEVGGAGKTEFAKWLVEHRNAFYWTNGKTADFAYAYNAQPIVVFDFTRTLEDHVNYQVIESVKNGLLVSSKYQSCLKSFPTCWVLVFSNFMPKLTALSADRWVIVNNFPKE